MYNQQLMVNDPIKVVIAPWGNPFGWNRAKYSYEGKQTEANTTLDVWLEHLKPDKVCLIVPDTVIDKKYINKDYFERFANEGYCFYKSMVKNSVYSFLTDKNKVRNYSPEIVKFYINYNTGTYEHLKFEREAADYYLNLYWIFYKFFIKDLQILDKIKNHQQLTLEVYLDTTHGVNFMPALTLEALQKFLKALSAAPIKIHLKVFNAEPVTPFSSNEVSELLLIYEETFEKLFTEITFTSEQKKEWVETNYDKYKNVLLFLTGVIKGYPLLVYNHFDLSINGSKQLNEDYIRNIINSYELNQQFKVNECETYEYPKNVPEFFREGIGRLKELERAGLVNIDSFKWRKIFLQIKDTNNSLPLELDLLIIALILKQVLKNIYQLQTSSKVSLENIEKLLLQLYKNTPLESYINQNLNSLKEDICKLTNLTTRDNQEIVLSPRNIRNFQSHLGILLRGRKIAYLSFDDMQIQNEYNQKCENNNNYKQECRDFLEKNKNKIYLEYLQIKENSWKNLIKNDLFGFPI
jgi:CRISPR-associated protein Csx1